MKDRLAEALKAAEGYVEIRVQDKDFSSLVYRRGETDKITVANDVGGCVRALVPGGGWGFATFNSLEGLTDRVREAVASSKAIEPEEEIKLAPVKPVEMIVRAEIEDDPRKHSLEEKVQLVEGYDSLIRSHDNRIIDNSVMYSDAFSTTHYINTEGAYFLRERMDVVLMARAMGKDGDNVQSAHDSWSSRQGFGVAVGKDDKVKRVAQLATDLLEADQVKAGKYTVVLDPLLAGVFIHEAFGHLSESDHIVENPQAREMMKLGRRFGPDELNIYEDGTVKPDIRGTIMIDDEGVPARKNYLVKEGVLVGRLHNRETAAKMNEPLTGNSRAQSYSHMPIIRMTNTAIAPGDVSFEDMIADIEEGIYCIDAYGGQTMMENFSFSSGHAFMIRNGKIEEMVRDAVLQGNLFQTLKNIEAIGDDFRWSNGAGRCGKGGQAAPVGMGSPHVRIKDVMIGGQQ